MKRYLILRLLLLLLMLWALPACGPTASRQNTTDSIEVQAVNPATSPAATALPPTVKPSETPALVETSPPVVFATPTSIPVNPPISPPSLLDSFPLWSGAVWVYSENRYSAKADDPTASVQALYEITQKVVETEEKAGIIYVEIEQTVKKVKQDPDWQDDLFPPEGDRRIWYILMDNQVYSSPEKPPIVDAISLKQLTLEYTFPLKPGQAWCPLPDAQVEQGAGMCDPVGQRMVIGEQPFPFAPGPFDQCFQLRDNFNNGSPLQTFCVGVGVVKSEFVHMGSPFGYTRLLVEFTPGTAP